MPKVFKMKDISDSFTIKKDDIPSLPMRMLAIGRTGCGKSSIALGNLLLRDVFYRKDTGNIKPIWKESEREYGKKQYKWAPGSLEKIKSLKDQGKSLCDKTTIACVFATSSDKKSSQ